MRYVIWTLGIAIMSIFERWSAYFPFWFRCSVQEDAEQEEFDDDDGSSVETKFLQIVQRMQLSHLETAALRLAIARNDASVREAIEAFRLDRNESSLMVALRSIAQETIRNTLSEQEGGGAGDDDREDDDQNDEEVKFCAGDSSKHTSMC